MTSTKPRRTGPTMWDGAESEARRILKIGLSDVLPDDAATIGSRTATLDQKQDAAVTALAKLIRKRDRERTE